MGGGGGVYNESIVTRLHQVRERGGEGRREEELWLAMVEGSRGTKAIIRCSLEPHNFDLLFHWPTAYNCCMVQLGALILGHPLDPTSGCYTSDSTSHVKSCKKQELVPTVFGEIHMLFSAIQPVVLV